MCWVGDDNKVSKGDKTIVAKAQSVLIMCQYFTYFNSLNLWTYPMSLNTISIHI